MRLHKNLLRTVIAFFISTVCFSLILFFFYKKDNKYTDNCLQPISGVLCLDENSLKDDLFYLTNQWQFYPEASLTPDDFKQGLPDIPMEFITIGKYNDFSMGNKEKSPYGEAAYRLCIELPEKSRVYSLYLPEIFSSYRLYVNDTLLAVMGDPDNGQRETGIKTISFPAKGPTEILIQTANHSHFYSGMTYPPIFGLEENVWEYQHVRLFLHSAVIILVLLLCVFSAYFFLKLRDKRAGLFSLMSLLVTVYICYPVFYTFFSTEKTIWYGLELFTTYAIYFLYVYLQNVFLNCRAKGYRVFSIFLLLFSAAAFIYGTFGNASPMVHYIFSCSVTAVKILVSLYLTLNLVYAAVCKEGYSSFVPVLTSIVCVCLWSDRIFPLYEPKYGGFFPEYCSLIAVTAGAFFLWSQLTEAYRLNHFYEEEKKRLSTQVAVQKVHYDKLTEKIAESARQRHDMRHHLRTLYQFLENGEAEQAMRYLSSCEVSQTSYHRETYCSHPIADALLQYYKSQCSAHHISFQATLEMPVELSMEDTDISILFGNLLENAYEACRECQTDHPFIKIWGTYRESGFLVRFENTFSNPLKEKNGIFHSTKHDGPGIGTESVKKVVQQYHGTVEFTKEGHIFQVSIILPI
ncbi:GHKL domain-containing protein [Blautia coccoides]|uniref:GHKL domain-containing protein n=1 Tax=Blautia producta TaxID=33035 RepID=UPI00210C626E|nr:GHKL domain-containing protein [Blautia coccoides]MCQ4639535.1 GHKL domain-containing protein [Blautia coccoides]